ncbi:hypothetical protein SLS60_001624 [Paraconiothyrium brasiliense]|uniref:Methyltransferase domain-containing protein n=1 Tax=Paraconiothyrium brasiliense TaxID=300254 RepID=A0ABR3S0T9_9PLEO
MSQIHPQATRGFHAANLYETHRPSYPSYAISALLSRIRVAGVPGARLVELGAGTGKFTSLLAARPEKYEIVAGEPHDEMRGVLEGKALRGVKIVDDRGESLRSVEEDWAGGVVIAQDAVDEVNAPIDHTPTTPYESRLKAIIRSLPNPVNLYRELKWKDVLLPEQQQFFQWPLKEEELPYEIALSRESIWERFATMSQVSSLKGEELQVWDISRS